MSLLIENYPRTVFPTNLILTLIKFLPNQQAEDL